MSEAIHLVPVIDVNWVNFGPMDARRSYIAEPPPLEQCAEEVERCVYEFINLTGGKAAYSVHSGTYCRTGFYKEPFLSSYRKAIAAGAEVSVHTHEEIAGKGTRNAEEDHMKGVIMDRQADFAAAGITAHSYRGGHFAFRNYLPAFLETRGLTVDFSAAPGFNQPWWDAVWTGAPFSAFYLNRDNHLAPSTPATASGVLEIPLGADGLGEDVINYLYTDESNLDDLKRVWKTVAERGEKEGKPQFIHLLYHSSSMGRPEVLERLRRFVDFIGKNGAKFESPREAKANFDTLAAAA